jgi:tetratricopeptide (TPR) repeat protein
MCPGIRIAALGMLGLCGYACAASSWRLTRSEHFEVYSQGSDENAHAALIWFEQLRAFFLDQTGLSLDQLGPVRVIGFGSEKEYEPYRLRSSDAFYIGTEVRDYIVMPALGADEFRVAAHEYAHLILHASGLRYPPWLQEGLADLFSTVRVSERESVLGGELAGRAQTLRRRSWTPLSELLSSEKAPLGTDRAAAELFYAQSWALAGMVFLSPEYGPKFRDLVNALSFGQPSLEAFQKIYGKSAEELTRDLRAWVDRRGAVPVRLPGIAALHVEVRVSDVPEPASRALMAELLFAMGQLDRAEAMFRELAREAPGSADIAAALGAIAIRKGDHEGARREWKRAIENGVTDASLCYRYAALAGMAGLPDAEVRPALARAVELKPDFDDARYMLALLEKNAGHNDIAAAHLRSIRNVPPARAFNYWSVLADALVELGRRDEAITAAHEAARYAANPAEQARANQIVYFAQTDLAVQFARDSDGRTHMVTTRVPHETKDFNPFVEAGDDVRKVNGTLREIDCSGKFTRFVVETAGARLKLAIEDPSRVLMRNAPAEFVCGRQEASKVVVEYAVSKRSDADGLIRGVEFR